MCNFVVVAVTKLDSNNNNKKITLHSCTDQFKNSYILNNSTHSSALQCITYIGSSYHLGHQMPLLGGTSDCPLLSQLHSSFLNTSRLPYIVLLLATRCLYLGVPLTVHYFLNCIPHSSTCQDYLM